MDEKSDFTFLAFRFGQGEVEVTYLDAQKQSDYQALTEVLVCPILDDEDIDCLREITEDLQFLIDKTHTRHRTPPPSFREKRNAGSAD